MMTSLLNVVNVTVPILYAVLLYWYGVHFFKLKKRSERVISWLLPVTVVLHLFLLVIRGIVHQHFPIVNLFEGASFLAFGIIISYFYIEKRLKIKTTGVFVVVLVFALQVVSSALANKHAAIPAIFEDRSFALHTASAMLSYSALFVSALFSLMYLLLFYNIKNAQFGTIYSRLPSLEELSEMNTKAATLGFLLLSVAIFLGILYWKQVQPGASHFDPKVTTTYVTWMIYGILIFGKKIGHWTGKSLAYLSMIGFLVILLSVVLVNLFATSFHQFA